MITSRRFEKPVQEISELITGRVKGKGSVGVGQATNKDMEDKLNPYNVIGVTGRSNKNYDPLPLTGKENEF
jgi:hypothetical protein